MKGLRIELRSGKVIEVTHTARCTQPAEAWVQGHREEHAKRLQEAPGDVVIARIVEFESKYPIHRVYDVFGVLEKDTSEDWGAGRFGGRTILNSQPV